MKKTLPMLFLDIKEDKDGWAETGLKCNWKIDVDIKEKKIRLYFQESNGLIDWILNFKFFKKSITKVYKNQVSNMICHGGFIKAYKSANDVIMDRLKATLERHPDYEIVVIGWSHGGACAQLAVEDINFRFKIKPTLVTFGSPKVAANQETANYIYTCCEHVYEIGQNNDIVTKLPCFKEFKHVDPFFKGVGSNFNFVKMLWPWKYHTQYHYLDIYPEKLQKITA